MHESGTTDDHVFYEEPFMSMPSLTTAADSTRLWRIPSSSLLLPPKRGGSGLGLVITRQIIESHHGTLTCDSRPGDGCTFTIALPLTQN